MRLAGKAALVTGGTSGIGEAIARAFAAEETRVVVTGREARRGQAVVEAIGAASGAAQFIAADLASRAAIDRLVAEAGRAVGPLDILVNDAGIFPFDATERIDEATFDAVIATNVKAPFFLTAALAPQMAERGAGKIINITTVLAHRGSSGGALYGASKAALTLLTQAWAAEYGPRGVNVNAIAPHLVRAPGIDRDLAMLERIAAGLPARRYAWPAEVAEVAEAALYLASDAASYVHGVTLPVDGGFLAT